MWQQDGYQQLLRMLCPCPKGVGRGERKAVKVFLSQHPKGVLRVTLVRPIKVTGQSWNHTPWLGLNVQCCLAIDYGLPWQLGTWGHDSALPESFRYAKKGQMPPHQNNGVFLRSGSGRKMLGK